MRESSHDTVAPYLPWAYGRDDWEDLVHDLLQIRHGHGNYQRVPSSLLGDYGIDGFSTNGFAYQCYACDEPTTLRNRSDSQKKKITKDTRKFITNKTKLSDLFQSNPIRRWLLVVPQHDSSDVIRHAQNRATIVRNANLPYVNPVDFAIGVIQLQDLAVEVNALKPLLPNAYLIALDPIEEATVNAFLQSENTFIANVRRKHSDMYPVENVADNAELLITQVSAYLKSEELMYKLKRDNPKFWNRVNECCQTFNEELSFNGPQLPGSPAEFLAHFKELRSRIKTQAPFLSDDHVSLLARGTMTHALMTCSLNFVKQQ